jgi:DNA-binding NarL/FixJ family response regulator
MIEVLIADENALIRKGLKEILSEDSSIVLVGESARTEDLKPQIMTNNCDVIIIGITTPGKSAIDDIIDIKRLKPDLKVIILTIDFEDEVARRMLQAGASGYLKKDNVPAELLTAVRKVYDGGIYTNTSEIVY